jgi:hypothetical protein
MVSQKIRAIDSWILLQVSKVGQQKKAEPFLTPFLKHLIYYFDVLCIRTMRGLTINQTQDEFLGLF